MVVVVVGVVVVVVVGKRVLEPVVVTGVAVDVLTLVLPVGINSVFTDPSGRTTDCLPSLEINPCAVDCPYGSFLAASD